jgi:hydrophobic/amphiphilic exporter-1 (mainly G- bacteria), HAE1 family
MRGLDRNILVDIGLVVLIGLAAKNAILIVEFPKQAESKDECERRHQDVGAAGRSHAPVVGKYCEGPLRDIAH